MSLYLTSVNETLWSLGTTLLGAFFVLLYVAYLTYKTILQERQINQALQKDQEERLRERDLWRTFRFSPKKRIIRRAGGRCEWFSPKGERCEVTNDLEIDHIYPWSAGGWTIESNAQVLCHGHHLLKGGLIPEDQEIKEIEEHRKLYFPSGEDIQVRWLPTPEERAQRNGKLMA